MKISDKIDTIKNFIEFQLDFLSVDYETYYEEDETLGGYCYFICTDYAAVLFSDHTPDNSLKMFRLNNRLLQWADDSGLSENQRNKLKLYIPVDGVCDMLDYLSDKRFSKQ
jgi:hypothetical protein